MENIIRILKTLQVVLNTTIEALENNQDIEPSMFEDMEEKERHDWEVMREQEAEDKEDIETRRLPENWTEEEYNAWLLVQQRAKDWTPQDELPF